MNNNLPKFLLLGVMLFTTVFFSQQSLGDFSAGGGSASGGKTLVDLGREPLSASVAVVTDEVFTKEVAPTEPDFVRVGEKGAPAVEAKGALVTDIKTGKVYYGLNPEIRWPLASITKLVSAVVAKDFLDEDQEVTMMQGDFDLETNYYVLKSGGKYRVEDLIWAMLLSSSNEAAVAVARTHGYDEFIEAMNVKTERWGLKDTNFDDPSGLSVSNQSTLFDLKRIIEAIYEAYPEIFEMTTESGWTIYDSANDTFSRVETTNDFVGRDDFLGGKTGYTDEAMGNLVSLFSYQERPILVIVLGTSDRFGDTRLLYGWFTENFRI